MSKPSMPHANHGEGRFLVGPSLGREKLKEKLDGHRTSR